MEREELVDSSIYITPPSLTGTHTLLMVVNLDHPRNHVYGEGFLEHPRFIVHQVFLLERLMGNIQGARLLQNFSSKNTQRIAESIPFTLMSCSVHKKHETRAEKKSNQNPFTRARTGTLKTSSS